MSTKDKKQKKDVYKPEIIGQMYGALYTKKVPGVFSITLHLKEVVKPDVLQVALDDLVKRLPFINIEFKRGFFWYYHKLLDRRLLIEAEGSEPSKDSFRVIYGEKHVTLEILHMISDGRGASKIFTAFFVRYFELMGVKMDKQGYIDCDEVPHPEEEENAYARYFDKKAKKGNPRNFKKAYKSKNPPVDKMQLSTHKFDFDDLKERAQKYGATVNEFILACIFKATAQERNSRGGKSAKLPVQALMPFDCRGYFRSKTLHNFTSGTHIRMPETDDMNELVAHIRTQFRKVNKEFVLRDLCLLQTLFKFLNITPLFIKKHILRKFESFNASSTSIMFSNVGRVKMPEEIEAKIETMDLAMKCNPSPPHAFISATLGNTLSLSIKSVVEDGGMFQKTVDIILSH